MSRPWGKLDDAARDLTVIRPEPPAPISWEDIVRLHRTLAEDWSKPRLALIKMSKDTVQDLIDAWTAPKFDRDPLMPPSLLGIPVQIDDEIPRGEAKYFDQFGDQMDVAW